MTWKPSRPFSVTVISCLFIAAGIIGIAYHASELRNPFASEAVWVLFVRLLAVVGGIAALRGANWGRWLLILWMAYHVVLSAFHSVAELAFHAVFLAVIAFVLLRTPASAYFRTARQHAAHPVT
jgi:hypothetical protein